MIYVYAIADRPEQPLPRQSGLRGQELSKIAWRDIAAVVSAYDGAAPPQGADEVWRAPSGDRIAHERLHGGSDAVRHAGAVAPACR